MKDMISVIIPFYNSSKTIARCIQSVLNQTYHNFELLLINDGSTDHTVQIIQNQFLCDARVRLVNKEHAGVSAARNLGLKEAKGEYVQFIDSDDDIEPNMFERMRAVMIEQDADIVTCNFNHPCIKSYAGTQIFDMAKSCDRIRMVQSTFVSVLPWSKLFRREVITDDFDEELSFAEDELFVFANMCNARKVVCIEDVLYHYYVAPLDSPYEELSVITRLAKADDFWRTKKTFWYMRAALMPKVQEILYQHFRPEEFEDIQFARAFDYMIWELVILYYNGADRTGLIYEMQSIFKEKRFLESIRIREKYGIHMKSFTEEEYNAMVIQYTTDCMNAYEEILKSHRTERPFYVCLALFVLYFTEQCGPIQEDDIMAHVYAQIKRRELPELEFIRCKLNVRKKSLSYVI